MSGILAPAYALLLLAIFAAYAFAILSSPRAKPERNSDFGLGLWSIAGAALLLTWLREQPLLFVLAVAAFAVFRRDRRVVVVVAGLLLFAPVIWWVAGRGASILVCIAAVTSGVLALWLHRTPRARPFEDDGQPLARIVVVAFAVGIVAGLPAIPFRGPSPAILAWHHWGAYLAPVEAWLSGGAPWRDFPVQYGLGPTAIIAGACANDCWRAIYWVTVVANAAYFAILAASLALLTSTAGRALRWLAFLALFCAVFAWTSFPVEAASPITTPSVGGLRFLPLAAVLLCALLHTNGRLRREWIGHGAWALSAFWSPEAAAFATLVWWPHLVFRDATLGQSDVRSFLRIMARRGAQFAALAALVVGTLAALIAWLSAGEATLRDVFLYMLHPPGLLPANPVGPIWIVAATVAVTIGTIMGQADNRLRHQLFVVALAFMASLTYYLSRSHDNNVLNLFAFLVPLLAAHLRDRDAGVLSEMRQSFVTAILAAIVVFVVAFDGSAWRAGLTGGGAVDFGPSRLVARFAMKDDGAATLRSPDLRAVLREIPTDRPAVVCDAALVMPRSNPRGWWTGVNNPANFSPLPDRDIARYVAAGAQHFGRQGWLVVGPGCRGAGLASFAGSYTVLRSIAAGAYRAYLLAPAR